MRILNIMLSRTEGLIERTSVDYAHALQLANHEALTITSTDAWANERFDYAGHLRASFASFASWDPIATYKLRQIARAYEAHLAICHDERAVRLARKALRGLCPVVYVAHTHNPDIVMRADSVMATTRAVALEAELTGMAKEYVFHIPYAVELAETLHPHTIYQRPPVIGTFSEFTREKGIDLLLQTVAVMNARGLQFMVRIGGDGPERPALEALAESLGIARTVTFTGPVEDTHAFFGELDFYVSPAHHDLFGTHLLQAMAAGLACVSTDAEGPMEILHANEDALIVPRNDAESLALALERLITDQPFAGELATKGQQMVAKHYSHMAMARRLHDALDALPTEYLRINA